MPFPALLVGVAVSFAGTLLYRRGRRGALERAIDAALSLYDIGEFDTGDWKLRAVATAADSDSSIAHVFLALGRHWRGQWAHVDEELRTVEAWPQLVMIYPSRVLAMGLRAELAALRGEPAIAAQLLAQTARYATRAVAAQASGLFLTEALLAWHDRDASRFAIAKESLTLARLGPHRQLLLRVLDAELRDALYTESLTKNPHVAALVAHSDRLRAFVQRNDPAATSLIARVCDGRCGLHFGGTAIARRGKLDP